MAQSETERGRHLRVGVIGIGVMGSNQRAYSQNFRRTLAGVADPDQAQSDFVGRTLGCPTVPDVYKLLDLGVDAVTIAAPTHLHREVALACIKRGVHVMVEKPIASSIEEGRDIIAAARTAGAVLMVGHVERFNPAVQAIKDALHGEDILSISITRVGPFPPRMSNVGVVIDLAVHDIDLISWFTGSKIVEVQPQLSSVKAEREDIALLQFRTASGVLAQINTNWLTPFKARTVHVATKRKYVIGDLLNSPGHRMLRLSTRRQLLDAASLGWTCRAVARRVVCFRAGDLHWPHPGGHRRGRRREVLRSRSAASIIASPRSCRTKRRAERLCDEPAYPATTNSVH